MGDLTAAFDYARGYYRDDEGVIDDFELLSRYRPEVFAGYITLRQAAFNTGPDAALSAKLKELVILAIEIARTKVNEPPTAHARWAVEAGATPAEIAEVIGLCIMIGGMLTYQESGRFVLREAEQVYARTRE
jgi:alkylhydroperoxidase/carboxymuconolactone decarboxylase family protein YurZ